MFSPAASVMGYDPQLVSVPLDKLFLWREFSPELFVRLGASRFVKVAHSLDELSEKRRNWYREKGVTELFLHRRDYERFLAFHQTLASRLHQVGSISGQKKVTFAVSVLELVMADLFQGPLLDSVDSQRLTQLADVAMTSVNLVLKHVQLVDVLHALQRLQSGILGHSISVAFHAVLVGHELGFRSQRTQMNLFLSGLLHEIGKRKLNPELLNRPLASLSASEKLEFDGYPELGGQILRNIPKIPEVVAQAVALHREDSRFGSSRSVGSKARVNRFARIIGVCDDFVELKQSSVGGCRENTETTLREMLRDSRRYDRPALLALVRIYLRSVQEDHNLGLQAA